MITINQASVNINQNCACCGKKVKAGRGGWALKNSTTSEIFRVGTKGNLPMPKGFKLYKLGIDCEAKFDYYQG